MKAFLLASLSCIFWAAFSQADPQKITDDVMGVQDSDLNYEDQLESLALLVTNPLDLNKITPDELRMLNLLSESQVQQFLNYRTETGHLISIYELQAVPDFDLETINKLKDYISVRDPNSIISATQLKQQVSEGNHYLILRQDHNLEKKAGFRSANANTSFLGSPIKHYLRFRSSKPGKYSFGMTAENDSGEQFTWSPSKHRYGFDFVSFHARIENKGIIRNLILGDFNGQYGQGLTLGGGFGFGKSAEAVVAARRCQLGFVPYSSSHESLFFRGVATTLNLGHRMTLSFAISSLYQDSNILIDTLESTLTASSIIASGFHRNRKELDSRDTNKEINQVVNLDYNFGRLNLGAIAHHISFSESINRRAQPYSQFTFHGNQNTNVGMYFNVTKGNALFFGEASQTMERGHAYIVGALLSLSPKFDIALVQRSYQPDFITFYSNALSENSVPQNETGTYWGWKYKFSRKITASGYVDLFRFPWLKYRSYRPSPGHEILFATTFQPARSLTLRIQIREESKERNESLNTDPLYHPSKYIKRNFLLNLGAVAQKRIRFNTRIQGSTFRFEGKTTTGVALFQDASIDIGKFELSIRHAIFQTDNYDNRQYAYEKDVWLAYSLPAVSGVGVRNYAMIQYQMNKTLTLWIKYTRVRYLNQEIIGSGQDAIQSSSKNDLKFQLRIKL